MSAIDMALGTVSTSGLAFIWLEITAKCNLTCVHCYAESGPTGTVRGNMQYDDWDRVISDGAELGCRELQFIGGEPTMHPDLPRLIALARQKGFKFIEVFTNATRLSGALLQCFREYRVDVASSFYSTHPDIHERITGCAESWENTLEGFRGILEAGLPLRVGIIETALNVGQLRRTTEFLNSLGVQKVTADRLRGVGRGQLQMVQKSASEFDELCGQCWKGRLCVTPSGATFPCVFARSFFMGDAREGLSSIIDSEKLVEFRSKVRQEREHFGALNCGPQCEPNDCNPNGCQPSYCAPDFCCSPNEANDCGPDR